MATINSETSSGPGNASWTPKADPTPRPPGTKQTLRDIGRLIVELWWRFFDWPAIVSWKTLLIIYGLGLILAAMLNRPNAFVIFVVASAIIKIIAGGKRRAELLAAQATQRAEAEQLERTVVEARMEALQAQIEPHFLFNTLGSILRGSDEKLEVSRSFNHLFKQM